MAKEEKLTVAFLVFEGMQLLDFANPWEVFGMWNSVRKNSGRKHLDRIKFSIDSTVSVSTRVAPSYVRGFLIVVPIHKYLPRQNLLFLF